MQMLLRAPLPALALLILAAGPAAAVPPESRIMYRLSGTTATAEFAEGCTTSGDLARCRYWMVTGVDDNTTQSPGEPTTSSDVVCGYTETWWLLESGEPAAVSAETGCVQADDRVLLDARELIWATLRPTDVSLELISCSPSAGWEALCELPASRVASVAAEFTGTGELITSRSHWHGTVPFAPDCIELDVDATKYRDAEASATIGGVELSSYRAYLSYGRHSAKVTCR